MIAGVARSYERIDDIRDTTLLKNKNLIIE